MEKGQLNKRKTSWDIGKLQIIILLIVYPSAKV